MSKLGEVLIEKLTKYELTDFCEVWDDGSFDEIIIYELLSKDAENFPGKYVDPDQGISDDAREVD